jgi:hypothetical protein
VRPLVVCKCPSNRHLRTALVKLWCSGGETLREDHDGGTDEREGDHSQTPTTVRDACLYLSSSP